MNQRGFISNIVLIAVVLGIVFLSQQEWFKPVANNMYSVASGMANPYVESSKMWFQTHIYPRVSQEVAKRGEIAGEEIEKQKNNAAIAVWESVKNYFTAQISKIFSTKVE